jgi:hypothetical protein
VLLNTSGTPANIGSLVQPLAVIDRDHVRYSERHRIVALPTQMIQPSQSTRTPDTADPSRKFDRDPMDCHMDLGEHENLLP